MKDQSEVEDLFKKINKRIQQNGKCNLQDSDMNKVRAHVIQSQRPMQAVRLLQKEREERDIDERFNRQKDEIISKAKQLDEEGKLFAEMQKEMTAEVQGDIAKMVKNQQKRKEEHKKLQSSEKLVKQHNKTILTLEDENKEKERLLTDSKLQLEEHKQYTEFLEEVAGDKELGQTSAGDVNWIRMRFLNLKMENRKLKERKLQINEQIEDINALEKETLLKMKTDLFEKNKQATDLQHKIEVVHGKNTALEAEFENEINKANDDQRQAGQMIASVSHIYSICEKISSVKGRKIPNMKKDLEDRDPELVPDLLTKLKVSQEVIGDLISVSKVLQEHADEKYGDKDLYAATLARVKGDNEFKTRQKQEQDALQNNRKASQLSTI